MHLKESLRPCFLPVLAAALLLGVSAAYSALLPDRQTEGLVACNLKGQEEAVMHCANNLLT